MHPAMLAAFRDELQKIAMVAPGTLRAGSRVRGPIGEMVRGWMGMGEHASAGGIKQRLRMVKDMNPDAFKTFVGKATRKMPGTVAQGTPTGQVVKAGPQPTTALRDYSSKPKWTMTAEQMRQGGNPLQLAAMA